MLKKCLKYDFKASLLIWCILSAAVLVMSTPGGFAIRAMNNNAKGAVATVSMLVIVVYYILGVIYLVAGIGLGIYRFYQSFRTDEAYLTFTLPVKRKTLLHSKLLSTLIMFLSTLFIILIALMISFSIVPKGNQSMLDQAIENIGNTLSESYRTHGLWTIVYIFQVAVLCFEAITAIILVSFSIANRTSSNKNRTKARIGRNIAIVLLFYLGMGVIFVPIILLVTTIISYTEAVDFAGTLTRGETNVVTFLAYVMFTMAAVILNAILYKDNLSMIKNKLNLT